MHKPISLALAIVVSSAALLAAQEKNLDALEEQAFKQATALVEPSIVRIETVGGLDRVGQVLVGDGPQRVALVRKAADLRIGDRVHFLGTRTDIPNLLAAADVYVQPSRWEGFGIAALEAMAAGLPVILSPGCNLPEAAEAGAGLIVEPQVEPLAAALRSLLTDAERRLFMGAAGRVLVNERFTWAAVADQLERVYESAARR